MNIHGIRSFVLIAVVSVAALLSACWLVVNLTSGSDACLQRPWLDTSRGC